MKQIPDKMTGKDLQVQEEYEASVERNLFNNMDYVDRRDRKLHIVSRTLSRKGMENYDKINWSK